MKDKRRLADTLLVLVLVASLCTNFYYLNEANKAEAAKDPTAAGAMLSKQPGAQTQSQSGEQAKLQKAINDQLRSQVENKKKFLTDISEQLPVISENDINNSTLGEELSTVKTSRQQQYAIIKKVIAAANLYHLTGAAADSTVFAYVSEAVRKGVFESYSGDGYSYFYRIEPAKPGDTALAGEKGYVYYVYTFYDSYMMNSTDPHGDIQKYVMLVVKDGNGWKVEKLMRNN